MKDEEYRQNMDAVIRGLALADATTASVTEETLTEMERTLSLADAIGPIVEPTLFKASLRDDRLRRQREAIHLIRKVREFIKGARDAK